MTAATALAALRSLFGSRKAGAQWLIRFSPKEGGRLYSMAVLGGGVEQVARDALRIYEYIRLRHEEGVQFWQSRPGLPPVPISFFGREDGA